jgi:hypothetical protein
MRRARKRLRQRFNGEVGAGMVGSVDCDGVDWKADGDASCDSFVNLRQGRLVPALQLRWRPRPVQTPCR